MKAYFFQAIRFLFVCLLFTGGVFGISLLFVDETTVIEESYIEKSIYETTLLDAPKSQTTLLGKVNTKDTGSTETETEEKDRHKNPAGTQNHTTQHTHENKPHDDHSAEISLEFIPREFEDAWSNKENLSSILSAQIIKQYINTITISLYEERVDVRGRMKGKTIKLYGPHDMQQDELLGVFIHELAHYIDLYFFSRNKGNDLSNDFYKHSWYSTIVVLPGQEQKDFVSGYAMTNKYEDFAESLTYYIFHNNDFKRKAKKSAILQEKYDFIKNVLFANNDFIGTDFSAGNVIKSYYRDITKINFSRKNFLQYLEKDIY